jgi:hypothetical protein
LRQFGASKEFAKFFARLCSLTGHVSLSQLVALLSLKKRAKIGFMGHNKGRDNVKNRAKRRKKHERLASAKKNKNKTKNTRERESRG